MTHHDEDDHDHNHDHNHDHPHGHSHHHASDIQDESTSIEDIKKYLAYYIDHIGDHEKKLYKLKEKLPKDEYKKFIDESVKYIGLGVKKLKELDDQL